MHLIFSKFGEAVTRRFDELTKHDMFRTAVDKDELWNTYLVSFPEGTNPIFRERTEHDCSCCRQFVRAVGSAVAVVDGKLVCAWDVKLPDQPAYQAVADAMAALVKSKPIENIFLHYEKTVGSATSNEHVEGSVRTWHHFSARIPHRANTGRDYYCDGKNIGPRLGEARACHDVFLRSLTLITRDATDTVLELIAQNSLYRGNEQKFAIEAFSKEKKEFDKLKTEEARDIFAWSKVYSLPASVTKFRNTAIGTLLSDISEGYDLEDAVASFERKVAPENYKRPTALVTKGMVDKAKKKLEELGLTPALERRFAKLSDITINNIIFANNDTKKALTGSVFDEIPTKGQGTLKSLSKVQKISIEDFIKDVVPKAESIEVMVENKHSGNFVSLVAPVHNEAPPLFKWDNNFSWAYNGDVTDSIKERVKNAGGNVTGDLCCRLAWYNHDDLDFHMIEPSGTEIYFSNRLSRFSGGQLDVDMNAGSLTREPVENIFYPDRRKMKEGKYKLFVRQFRKRETKDVGFDVEIDYMGELHRFAYKHAIPDNKDIVVAEFKYTHDAGIEFLSGLESTSISRKMWDVQTQDFQKVSVLMASPNHWEGEKGLGNKHYFFMLDGCKNDGEVRGFFNEFLRPELNEHRKVIEIVGSKMKANSSPEQLSGVGFSDTKRAEVLVRVKGKVNRQLLVMI